MNVQDDLFLGPPGLNFSTASGYPPQDGVGPMGRLYVYNVIPLTLQVDNVAGLQHTTAATALTLAAGTGTTAGLAPDGSGRTVIIFDVPRAVSFSSTANMSGQNVTVRGFDVYGQPMTQTRAGPNQNTVNTTKAFKSVVSVTPAATDGTNFISVGTSDVLGLPWYVADAGYLISKWGEALALDTGTFVAGVTTTPSATTGDVRGTYTPNSASDGTRRLVMWMHLTAIQVGPNATLVGAIGAAQF